mgnify:CR=1 FL=1
MFIDLHMRTTASDGQYSPSLLVDMAGSQYMILLSWDCGMFRYGTCKNVGYDIGKELS